MTRQCRAFGIADAFIGCACRRLAALGDFDGACRVHIPGMTEIEIGDIARHQRGIGESGAIVLTGVTRDIAGRTHGFAHGFWREIGGAGGGLALTEIHGHTDAAVTMIFECLDLTQAYGDGQTRLQTHARFTGARAQTLGLVEYLLHQAFQFRRLRQIRPTCFDYLVCHQQPRLQLKFISHGPHGKHRRYKILWERALPANISATMGSRPKTSPTG